MLDNVKKILIYTILAIALSASASFADSLQPAAFHYTGTYNLRESFPDLTGHDVNITAVCRSMTYLEGQPQNDYQPDIEHKCFTDAGILFENDTDIDSTVSDHATAIAAILLGSDPNAYTPDIGNFVYQGAAPQANLNIHEFWQFACDYIFPAKDIETDILTMSIGTTLDEWWTRGIERIAEKNGTIVIAAIGNGKNVMDPVLYPAAGANIIGVGVIDSAANSLNKFNLPKPQHSSAGPTEDGRVGPDIVAPGNCLVPNPASDTLYDDAGDWSSFATPVVAGTVSLLVQKAKQDENLKMAVTGPGSNSILKAILLNSATKLPYWHKGMLTKDDDHEVSLDYIQGAGALNAERAMQQLLAGRSEVDKPAPIGWDSNVIADDPKFENFYRIEIKDKSVDTITATLTWNKHYEKEYPFEAKPEADSNLRLELWAIDDEKPENNRLIDYSDSTTDNIEHIHCPTDPNFSTYEIIVRYTDKTDTDSAPMRMEHYGLAWNVTTDTTKDNPLWYDLDMDGTIGFHDFEMQIAKHGTSAQPNDQYLPGDINMNNQIDDQDLKLLLSKVTPPAQ